MMANAIATAMRVRGRRRQSDWQEREDRLDQRGERRLANPSQADARHRDAELRRGDVAVRIGHGAAHGARAAVALGDQLVDARLADRHDREFRRDEEAVGEHQRHDADQAPQMSASESSIIDS